MTTKNEDTIDMFYGYWKYLGVTAVFLFGVALTWWGATIMLNDWITIRTMMGPLGNFIMIPFSVGIVLCLFSFIKFLQIIRGD